MFIIKFSRLQFGVPSAIDSGEAEIAMHHGKMSSNKYRTIRITHEYASSDLKMWTKRLPTEIHIIITICIHNRSIYFKGTSVFS